jgi:5-oxoprolinase (ATP-hydrolysing) subunit A
VSFRDLAGFGRRRMECAPDELAADVLYQLGAVSAFCTVAGTRVRYVKPHGALYHELAADRPRAEAVATAVAAFDPTLAVLGPPGSALLGAANGAGLTAVREGFPDRAYQADGRLVSRSEAGALIGDPAEVARRAVAMATRHEVPCVDGSTMPLAVDSLCIHGDSSAAVATATAVRDALAAAGCRVRPFA